MANKEIAQIFYDMADILEFQDIAWKPQAYRKAAQIIEATEDSIEQLYIKKGIKALKDLPGIGQAISKKIEEYIKTGKVSRYEELKKELPKGISQILDLPGMGPKKAKILYKKLGVTDIDELKKAAKEHKISSLDSFKEKSEANILKSIKQSKKSEKKPLSYVLPVAEKIKKSLQKLKQVEKAEITGSLRRRKPLVHDIDILAATKENEPVMNFFTGLSIVKRVLAKGNTKSSIITDKGLQADLRLVDKERFGSALLYFTGSKEHNIMLRRAAIKKGYKLSEYGLFRGDKLIASKTEKEIYEKLGLEYLPPEKRES